jgi:translation initiation factor IF-2
MLIDGNFIDEECIMSNNKKFLKQYNNLFISEEQKEVLDKYDINIYNYNSISSLIYDIEEVLNNSVEELDDLEWVSQTISEYNYYNNTNK